MGHQQGTFQTLSQRTMIGEERSRKRIYPPATGLQKEEMVHYERPSLERRKTLTAFPKGPKYARMNHNAKRKGRMTVVDPAAIAPLPLTDLKILQ